MNFIQSLLNFFRMDNLEKIFKTNHHFITKESLFVFFRKCLFFIPTGIVFSVTVLLTAPFLTMENNEPIPFYVYVILYLAFYICFIIPVNIIINLFRTIISTVSKKENTFSNSNKAITPFDTVAYFRDGQLYKTQPFDLENWYDVNYIESDGTIYNMEDANSILTIATPHFGYCDALNGYGATGSLDYVLRMKAGVFYNRKEKELCSACLWKSTELMLVNDFYNWQNKDFERIINWHYELGMFEEAEKAKEFLLSYERYTQNAFDYTSKKIKNSVLQHAKESHHDLIVFDDYGWGCCSKCARMRGRVYSISGKSKIFPKLPEYVLTNGNFHLGCRCTMSLYFGDKIFYKGERVDAVKSSNRPWTDDRDEHEIESYEKYLSILSKEKREKRNRDEYHEILKKLPDIAPKSFSAYVQMKNQSSPRFLEIKKIAEANGIIILSDTSKKESNKTPLTGYELELFARQCNYKLEHDDKL